MKTKFEQWLDGSVSDDGATTLFRESASAYKAGCDRAAVIMAYLGVLATIRSRILEEGTPTGLDANAWAESQRNVRDDDKWDSSVFDLVTRTDLPQAFRITKDQRVEFQYFRVLRNKCAHGKGGGIDSSHVESLWAFARDNLPKIVVNGSLQGAIQAVLEHSDPNLTPRGKPFDELAVNLNDSLRTDEISTYLDELLGKAMVRMPGEAENTVREWFLEVLNTLSRCLDESHQPALTAWLGEERYFPVLQQLVLLHPESNAPVGFDDKIVRRLWHTRSLLGPRDIRLYLNFRRKQLIPCEQLDESIQFVAENVVTVEGLSSDELVELEGLGFWKQVKTHLLTFVIIRNAEFADANRRAQLVGQYLECCGIDKDLGAAIHQMEKSNVPFDVENVIIGYLRGHSADWGTLKSTGELPAEFVGRVEEEESGTPLFEA